MFTLILVLSCMCVHSGNNELNKLNLMKADALTEKSLKLKYKHQAMTSFYTIIDQVSKIPNSNIHLQAWVQTFSLSSVYLRFLTRHASILLIGPR